MDQLLGLLIAVPLFGATLVGLFVVMNALFTPWIARTCEAAETQAARSFLVGLVNLIFGAALIAAIIALADNTGLDFVIVVAVLLAAVLVIAMAFGLAAMVQVVGARILPGGQGVRALIWGTIALTLGCLAPYVGWFGLLPYVALRGLGAFVLALFSARRKVQVA
jgi:hypothetical protein